MEQEITWNNDGHSISLRLEKNLLVITGVHCPHLESESKPCHLTDDGCIVKWFLLVYGLECNVVNYVRFKLTKDLAQLKNRKDFFDGVEPAPSKLNIYKN